MELHTTNYYNTFITVADDCPASAGEVPPQKGDKRSVANIEFDLINNKPYLYTSDDVLFKVYTEKKDLTEKEYEEERKMMFSKGQACMRASPLTKRYGWGIHFYDKGKMALYGCDSDQYHKFSVDDSIKLVKAVRSSKK